MTLLVLVVHDEPDVEVLLRQQFRGELHAEPHTMEFAQSSAVALQRVTDERAAWLILILSDISLPDMTRLEILLKAKAARPDVLILMITAFGGAETKLKALEAGAKAPLTKPINFIALRNEIETRIERTA